MEKTASADTFRSLAMYITFAIITDSQRGRDTSATSSSLSENGVARQRRKTESSTVGKENNDSVQEHKIISNFEVGTEVLQMLASTIIEDMSGNYARRFARNVTSKVQSSQFR